MCPAAGPFFLKKESPWGKKDPMVETGIRGFNSLTWLLANFI